MSRITNVERERREKLLARGLKECSHCKEIKSINEFGSNKRRKDGLCTYCRSCASEICLKWTRENRQKYNATTAKWRDKNREKLTEYNRIYKREQRKRQKENKE